MLCEYIFCAWILTMGLFSKVSHGFGVDCNLCFILAGLLILTCVCGKCDIQFILQLVVLLMVM